jgi:predicted dehydrogenase
MIGSRSREKALEYCKEFGCDSYGTYEEVLENRNIDAVYISLPIGLHEQWTIKSAEAGKHVLCEKSSTTSLESAKKMVKVCKENKVRLLEGFMFKYHPQHKQVLDLIQKGSLGELLTFQGNFCFPFPDKDNIRMKQELECGVLNDAACYPIYASRMLFAEEPISVFCNLKKDNKTGVDTKADILLTYPNGKSAFASSAFGAQYRSTYSLLGTNAHLETQRAYSVPIDMETKISLTTNDHVDEIKFSPADHFKLMLEDFCNELCNGKTKDYESDLLAQARILEAARLSDKEKRIVEISKIC